MLQLRNFRLHAAGSSRKPAILFVGLVLLNLELVCQAVIRQLSDSRQTIVVQSTTYFSTYYKLLSSNCHCAACETKVFSLFSPCLGLIVLICQHFQLCFCFYLFRNFYFWLHYVVSSFSSREILGKQSPMRRCREGLLLEALWS